MERQIIDNLISYIEVQTGTRVRVCYYCGKVYIDFNDTRCKGCKQTICEECIEDCCSGNCYYYKQE